MTDRLQWEILSSVEICGHGDLSAASEMKWSAILRR